MTTTDGRRRYRERISMLLTNVLKVDCADQSHEPNSGAHSSVLAEISPDAREI